MIDGIGCTPTQEDSHAELQARQGWSAAAMRDEIEAIKKNRDQLSRLNLMTLKVWSFDLQDRDDRERKMLAEIERLELFMDKITRQLSGHQSRVGNALAYLRLVNCGNVDQAKIASAILELEDIYTGEQ